MTAKQPQRWRNLIKAHKRDHKLRDSLKRPLKMTLSMLADINMKYLILIHEGVRE